MSHKPKSMSDLIDFTVVPDAPIPGPSGRRLTIMSALATGWLPWGVQWTPDLQFAWDYSDTHPQSDIEPRPQNYRFILSCGHVMRIKEAQMFVSAGLLQAGHNHRFEETLIITDAGRAWLERNWIS